jgi:2-oxoglutarate ferredoxin oxidoreductase subunit delta
MIRVKIDEEKCKGCQLCIYNCPLNLLKESKRLNKKGIYVVELDFSKGQCIGCKQCAIICPEQAIEIIDDEKEEKN